MNKNGFSRCGELYIGLLRKEGRFSTAHVYQNALFSFNKFCGNTSVSFRQVTRDRLRRYGEHLYDSGLKPNTVSTYMRMLRSIYNRGVESGSAPYIHGLFRDVYTGVDKTRKRAIDEQHILDLCKLSLPALSPLALARDLFLFSYCTRGMAFVDMAFLCKKNIHNGYICYTRKKTGQQLVIRVEPLIQKIISRYAGQTKRSQYLLPIISSEDPVIAFSQYQTALGYYNKLLKRISKILDLDISLSSYTARHSWATAARNHNVPISVISAGMGHTTEKTTQIYLASLESSVIDQANQSILSALV